MERLKFISIAIIAGVMSLGSCVDSNSANPRSSYLDAPVPHEIQRHFKRDIKWDKWRQEAWLRGDIIIDSNELGQKWLIIKHNQKIIPDGEGVSVDLHD